MWLAKITVPVFHLITSRVGWGLAVIQSKPVTTKPKQRSKN
jgi:hypothetical protein